MMQDWCLMLKRLHEMNRHVSLMLLTRATDAGLVGCDSYRRLPSLHSQLARAVAVHPPGQSPGQRWQYIHQVSSNNLLSVTAR